MASTANPLSPRHSNANPRAWVEAQDKAFKGWVNAHLAARQMQIEDLVNGFSDGIAFVHLLEILEKKPLDGCTPFHKAPRHKFDSLSAIVLCLGILKSRDRRGLNLPFDEEAIYAGTDERVALALAWRIICTYAIDVVNTTQAPDAQAGSGGFVELASSPEKQLMAWCNKRLPEQFQIGNFTTDWQSGHVLVMLVNQALDHTDQVSEVDYEDMDPDELLEGIFEMAETQLAIPQLLDVDMVLDHPNKQAIMTYVSLIRTAVEASELERSHLNESMAKVQKAMASLEDQLQNRIKELEAELESSRAENAELRNQLEQERQKNERDHGEWQLQKTSILRDLETAKNEKNELEHSKTILEQEKTNELEAKDKTISMLREQVEAARLQHVELQNRMDQIRAAEVARAAAEPSYDQTLVNDLHAEIAGYQKQVNDIKRESSQKIDELTTYWEAQKAKYISLYDEYKSKLAVSNKAGREYRERCYQLDDEKSHMSDQIAALNMHVGELNDQLQNYQREVTNLKSEMETKEAVFRLQLHELGTFIKDMKDREDERDNVASQDSERRLREKQALQREMENARALVAQSAPPLDPAVEARQREEESIRAQFAARPIEPIPEQKEQRESGIIHMGLGGGYAQLQDEDDMYGPGPSQPANIGGGPPPAEELKAQYEDPILLNKRAFDRKTEAIKTKFKNEKIVTTWHYLGSSDKIHEVILRHNTKGKKSKRVVTVDGEVKYNEKSNDMEFFIRRDHDNLRIQILDVGASGEMAYRLFINDVAFDELRRQHFRAMAQKRRESGIP